MQICSALIYSLLHLWGYDVSLDDLKNFTKLISELKQKEFDFRIIRHKKKHALLQRFFKSFKKN